MVTNHPDSAAAPLTQQDRDMLAWYLTRGLTSDNLKREDIAASNLRAWRHSPHIAPHIEAFHELNAETEQICRTRAKIEGFNAVSDALRSATTVSEKLHAVHALIRLNTSCNRSNPRRGDSTPSPQSRSGNSPARPRVPYMYLPPLPPFGRREHSPVTASLNPQTPCAAAAPRPQSPSATGSPRPIVATNQAATATPSTPAPTSSAAPVNGSPQHAAHAPCLPLPVGSATERGGRVFEAGEGRSPSVTAADRGHNPAPTASSSSPSSSLPDPTDRVTHTRDKSPARRLMETSGAAKAGAWP